jgi:DNA-binding MarR family transcriptional regulator
MSQATARTAPDLSTIQTQNLPFPNLAETRLYHSIMRQLNAWAKKHALTPARFEALGHIEANELALTQSDLARLLKVSQPSTSRMVNRLRRLQLIIVLENAHDRRKRMLKLTDEGKRRLTSAKLDFAGPLPTGFLPVQILN